MINMKRKIHVCNICGKDFDKGFNNYLHLTGKENVRDGYSECLEKVSIDICEECREKIKLLLNNYKIIRQPGKIKLMESSSNAQYKEKHI